MGQKKIAEAEAKKKETRRPGRPDRGTGQAGGGGGGGPEPVDAAAAEFAARVGAGRARARRITRWCACMAKAGVCLQAEVARGAVREPGAGGFHARGQARGQRVRALHELGREAGAGVDPVHAGFAHARARLYGGVAAVHGGAAMPGRRGPVSEVRRPVLRGAGRAGCEHAGQVVSHPDGGDAGGQHPPGGDAQGERSCRSAIAPTRRVSAARRARRASGRGA